MAKKTGTPKKEQKKEKKAPQVKKAPAAPAVETVATETVDTKPATKKMADVTIGDLMNQNGIDRSSLDANHRVELNGQIIELFVKNPNARSQFSSIIVDTMTNIAAIGVITAVADEAVNGNSTFAITIKREAYDALAKAGAEIGVKLPPLNALPAPEGDATQAVIESKQVEVSDETKEDLKKENAVANKKDIEMDPVKVAALGEEALKDSLTQILVKGVRVKNASIKDTLVAAVDFIQAYRIEKAKDNAELKQSIVERSMYEILTDIFSIVKPITYLRGIGHGMMQLIENENSMVSAFIVLRDHLIDNRDAVAKGEEPKACWDDQSIADCVRALVECVCENHKDRISKMLEDEKALGKKADKARIEGYEDEIKRTDKILNITNNINFDLIDEFEKAEELDESSAVYKAFVRVLKSYYPAFAMNKGYYKGLNENLVQRVGVILNLFCSPGSEHTLYNESSIIPLNYVKSLVPPTKAQEMINNGEITLKDICFCHRSEFKAKKDTKKA